MNAAFCLCSLNLLVFSLLPTVVLLLFFHFSFIGFALFKYCSYIVYVCCCWCVPTPECCASYGNQPVQNIFIVYTWWMISWNRLFFSFSMKPFSACRPLAFYIGSFLLYIVSFVAHTPFSIFYCILFSSIHFTLCALGYNFKPIILQKSSNKVFIFAPSHTIDTDVKSSASCFVQIFFMFLLLFWCFFCRVVVEC